MFGFLESAAFHDPQLGELLRSRGYWRGAISVGDDRVPLAISGTRKEPDALALQAAHSLDTQFAECRAEIENALLEHYGPYAEALARGELSESGATFPRIDDASQVWPHVSLVSVSLSLLNGVLATELAYTSLWDDEHTLGARLQNGKFIELCGSVLPA